MTKLQKILNFQRISLIFSIVAFVLSVFSIISVNKMNVMINNSDTMNRKFQPIKDIPDVEIIKPDGSIEKISASKSQDELSKILSPKKEENTNKENNIDKQNENKIKEMEKRIILNSRVKETNTNSYNKQLAPVSRKDIGNSVEIKKQTLKQNTAINDSISTNNVSVNNTKNETKKNNIIKNKIYGNFVVQVGAFRDRQIAIKQCSQIKKFIGNKNCDVATTNNKVFRSIIFPFNSYSDGLNFANMLLDKTKINCLVKKNG